jgi:hypothetical protein
MRNSFPGRPQPARGPAGTLLLSLALALSGAVLSACSQDTPAPSAPAEPTTSHVGTATPSELGTSAEVGRIIGRLPGTRRKAVRKQVTELIDRWWEAAYLEGDLRSADVSRAFPGFTAGARKRATFDRSLMTNTDLEAASITPLMRKVRLDLLAVGKRVRSVTARFDLRARVSATSGRSRRLQVRGRLFLTRRSQDWRVFGYDVSKGWL